jgi:PAS domain S-box-containing protein
MEMSTQTEKRQEKIQQQSEELKSQPEHLLEINEKLERLSLVASKTENVIIIMDESGNFEWVNASFVKRYGMDLKEFTRKKGKNLIQNSSYPEIEEIFEEAKRTRKAILYTARTQLTDNEHIWSQTTISPVLNEKGNIVRFVAIDSDITRLKEAEQQIESQRDELKKLNATKDRFFSIIAHDLKNPFHSIMGFSDLLTRNYDNIEEEKKKEFISLIKESSSSAYSLLENLLNWARTQTNRIKYSPSSINVTGIIREVYQLLNVQAQNKKVEISIPDNNENIYAFADYNMVFTVIRNLMNNALKFTKEGDTVSISANPVKGRLKISISDTGIGMTKEEKKNLFNLDELQSTDGTSGEPGTGLGLIVCREFILIHGGDIEVKSEKGKGSTFSFSLPLENE